MLDDLEFEELQKLSQFLSEKGLLFSSETAAKNFLLHLFSSAVSRGSPLCAKFSVPSPSARKSASALELSRPQPPPITCAKTNLPFPLMVLTINRVLLLAHLTSYKILHSRVYSLVF
eukprot:gb/GEZJ01003951.1/.p2 GENE.gb/GEZJ01003951.1/~~gb/GEZJ01003951.1/.p2  ORF type:complete len:117 (+),score=10.61 gb/GEZJ01003951.1/:2015-2365(+)